MQPKVTRGNFLCKYRMLISLIFNEQWNSTNYNHGRSARTNQQQLKTTGLFHKEELYQKFSLFLVRRHSPAAARKRYRYLRLLEMSRWIGWDTIRFNLAKYLKVKMPFQFRGSRRWRQIRLHPRLHIPASSRRTHK